MAASRLPKFQENFRALRGEMTQAQFSDKLGISRPTVGLYESGARIPDAEILCIISQKCGVSVDYLLGLSEHPTVSEDMKVAIETTGLTENAIMNLKLCNIDVLTQLLESARFPPLTADIQDLIDHEYLLSWMNSEIPFTISYQNTLSDTGKTGEKYGLNDIYRFYNSVRLFKYEIMESFGHIIEEIAPAADILSKARKTLGDQGFLSASEGFKRTGEGDSNG